MFRQTLRNGGFITSVVARTLAEGGNSNAMDVEGKRAMATSILADAKDVFSPVPAAKPKFDFTSTNIPRMLTLTNPIVPALQIPDTARTATHEVSPQSTVAPVLETNSQGTQADTAPEITEPIVSEPRIANSVELSNGQEETTPVNEAASPEDSVENEPISPISPSPLKEPPTWRKAISNIMTWAILLLMLWMVISIASPKMHGSNNFRADVAELLPTTRKPLQIGTLASGNSDKDNGANAHDSRSTEPSDEPLVDPCKGPIHETEPSLKEPLSIDEKLEADKKSSDAFKSASERERLETVRYATLERMYKDTLNNFSSLERMYQETLNNFRSSKEQ